MITTRQQYSPDLLDGISEIILSEDEIQQRIQELGREISSDYAGKNPLLIGVLKGVMIFLADLLRSITVPVEVDFMAVSAYSPEVKAKGLVRLVKDLDTPLNSRHVIFIEDVVDTGLTLNYLLSNLRTRSPASLEVCTLFTRNRRRLIEIPIRYTGFELPDRFVVGYGLDYREKYRNLPFVGLVSPQVFGSSNLEANNKTP